MKKIIIYYLITLLIVFSCTENNKKTDNKVISKIDTLISNKIEIDSTLNPDILLQRVIHLDTFEYSDFKSNFLFIKTGYILNNTNCKNAVVIKSASDSTIFIQIYNLEKGRWNKISESKSFEGPRVSFYVKLADYNFDNSTDIYVNNTSSNGYSMQRGYLFTLHNQYKIIKDHFYTDSLANMSIDLKTKTILSEELIEFSRGDFLKLGIHKNKWMNNILKTTEIQIIKN